VGSSPAIARVIEQVERVAPTDATVLITGESGTGKELVAQQIHERSGRRDRTMVRVNCASIPAGLFESEFFGHVRGAFTGATSDREGRFELANGGTLFLDEVGEVPLELQGKLLRVLQSGTFERVGESRAHHVDVRLIAATNRDLSSDCQTGRFRSDLYYRLSVFPISIPPLRQRREDIRPLAEHCLTRTCRRLDLPRPTLSDDVLARLETYPWPGNVRELENIIEHALIAGDGELAISLPNSEPAMTARDQITPELLLLEDLERLERMIIVRELESADWQIYGKAGAAERLGIPATTLASRMKRLGIHRPDAKADPRG
jgi:transcriptional regulator with GAF, ATPase, and Fis domain